MTDRPESRRIDVQFHFSPAFYTDLLRDTSFITTDRWSVENALAYMDSHGIAAGVMSVSTPGVDVLPAAESVTLARRLNDAAAEVARAHPGRFGNFATLPMQDPAAALAELARCLDDLQMDGVCMMSNVLGRYPGHESFAVVFDELQRRGTVLFIHPNDPAYGGSLEVAAVAEWPYDTGRAAIDLRDVVLLLDRAAARDAAGSRAADRRLLLRPRNLGRRIRHRRPPRGLRSRPRLFACDWPFAPDPAVAANIAGFEALSLSPAQRSATEHGTAEGLFPNLAGSLVTR
jgi:hypothetical protein